MCKDFEISGFLFPPLCEYWDPKLLLFEIPGSTKICPELEFLNNLWGQRNRLGIGLSYRPARLHRLEELILEIDSWAL
jgi:hypothetical protein